MNAEASRKVVNRKKSAAVTTLLNESLFALEQLGMPLAGMSNRGLERLSMVFLALADVHQSAMWKNAKGYDGTRTLRSRDVIEYLNKHFEESLSRGSYDDIRTEELKPLSLGNLVVTSAGKPNSSRNDPTRAYAVLPEAAAVLRTFGTPKWHSTLTNFLSGRQTLAAAISHARPTQNLPVKLPSGVTLEFSPGPHNELQKAVIEEFLPRYGYGAEVLYVGDAASKYLVREESRLRELDFFELTSGELPDIVAYSANRRWIYLIEAVHSSGPVSPIRHLELRRLTERCKADIIYVTAFLNRETFRKFAADISWETEVWIADAPDHLVHFNGDSFMGPHNPKHSNVHQKDCSCLPKP
ncbi:MAG: hypothetical protein K1X78_18230 [Verrucomicrobiaceae bacterium]|nr:hypothetical protein [Verrucomicrobiaceae bacterium]